MNLNKLLKTVKIRDSDMQQVLDANPKQIIVDTINIPVWKIRYKYTTARGNEKEGTKYMIHEEAYWDSVGIKFNDYIESQNKKSPYRKISNVEILDASYLGELIIE